jgi:hypothetical protein
MNLKKIYMLVLMLLSAMFAILVPISLLLSTDFATLIVVLIQEILYISLIVLSWKEFKAEGEKIEIELEKRKK